VFPLFFSTFGLGVERIGLLKAAYPAVWGCLQVLTGPLSDRWGRKGLIVGGMWVQAAGIFVTMAGRSFGWWMLGSVLLGVGTAMVYPALIAAVSDNSHPSWRARSLSVYRFCRGCPLGRDHRRHVGALLGHRLRGSVDLPVRRRRGRVPEGEGTPITQPIHRSA
jgi:MFS family permease